MASVWSDESENAALRLEEHLGHEEGRQEYRHNIDNGRRLYAQLSNNVRTDRMELCRIDPLYKLDTGPLAAPEDVRKTLLAWNVDPLHFVYTDVQSHSMRSHDPDIYSNLFNGRDGAMILKENFKARDQNLPLRRLFPSEVIWQCYQTAAREANKKTSKLRIIVRHSVENESTLNAIWHAARNSTCTQDEVPDLGYKAYTDVDDGFYAILGSTNGASMMRMLIDHKSQIGLRTVERVVVLRCKDIEQLTEREKHRTILIELSAKRSIPYPPIFRRAGPPSRIPRLLSTTLRGI